MKRTVFIIAIMLCALSTTYATNTTHKKAKTEATKVSTTTLRGLVRDQRTGETLAGASIMVNGKLIYSDLDGQFSIENFTDNNVVINVNMISYQEQTIVLETSKKTNELNINLEQL